MWGVPGSRAPSPVLNLRRAAEGAVGRDPDVESSKTHTASIAPQTRTWDTRFTRNHRSKRRPFAGDVVSYRTSLSGWGSNSSGKQRHGTQPWWNCWSRTSNPNWPSRLPGCVLMLTRGGSSRGSTALIATGMWAARVAEIFGLRARRWREGPAPMALIRLTTSPVVHGCTGAWPGESGG